MLLIIKIFSFSDAAALILARAADKARAIVCRAHRLACILLPTRENR